MLNYVPVLIVGAGPTGLSMAIGLQRFGIPFRLIDKKIKPVATSNAIIIQPRTLQIFDDFGILETALKSGHCIYGAEVYAQQHSIADFNFNLLPIPYQFQLGLAQNQTEQIMQDYLHTHNIDIEMKVELMKIDNQKEHTIVTLQHENGKKEEVQADWVIACDGANSIIRHQLGIPFVGKNLSQHYILADLCATTTNEDYKAHVYLSENGLLVLERYDKDNMRLITEINANSQFQNATTITKEQLTEIIQHHSSEPIQINKIKWISGFDVRERLLAAYSRYRVFFLGDAAHIHSPVLGQGMNTGIQDAYNLAWKLALVMQNRAKSSILTTYQDERQAVAREVLNHTISMTHVMCITNSFYSRVRNTLLGFLTKIKFLSRQIEMQITQLDQHYKPNELIYDPNPKLPGPAVGNMMLDVVLGKSRLFDYVRGIQHVLFIFNGTEKKVDEAALQQLTQELKQKYPQLIKIILIVKKVEELKTWSDHYIVDGEFIIHQHYQVKEPMFYFIRPDKYIGFRSSTQHNQQLLALLAQEFIPAK